MDTLFFSGNFDMRPVVAFGYCHRLCLCVHPSVSSIDHKAVCMITCDLFKLGLPNLDQIDLDPEGQVLLQSQISPISGLQVCQRDNCSPDHKIFTRGVK